MEYFVVKLGNKYCDLHSVCKQYAKHFRQQTKGSNKNMRFAILINRRINRRWEPNNYVENCYFCAIHLKGVNRKNGQMFSYPNFASLIKPVLHGKQLPFRLSVLPQKTLPLIEPLVEKDKIILPPLHIKLSLIKHFVKALVVCLFQNAECF